MAKNLVIVESPAKARTVGRFLGRDYEVKASLGHVRDLPSGDLGVAVDNGFTPKYVVPKEKSKVIADLKKSSKDAETIYLATDPDREGEAISWHLVNAAGWQKRPVQRVVFHQITEDAINEAFRDTREIDMRLVNAQQARRVLDRLVGYQLSPLLWRKIQRGLSAGRVQSVALKLVVDREREIEAFASKEYWTIDAILRKQDGSNAGKTPRFSARLQGVKGQRKGIELDSETAANVVTSALSGASYIVADVQKKEVRTRPAPPFITSTLQQEAWRKLRFSAKRTMALAQQLYEGLSIGSEGSVGLITYMRTDSVHVAPSALRETVAYIREHHGKNYLPKSPRVFTKKAKGAQEAHEAIRPTAIRRSPAVVKPHVSSTQFKLYELIWKRMLASQMADAVSDSTRIDIDTRGSNTEGQTYVFRATGSVMKFPGYRSLYLEDRDDPAEDDDNQRSLPELRTGEGLDCLGLNPEQHFTQPPPRYNDASLIRKLEEEGIGRPSTYAPTLSVIMERNYVIKEQNRLKPTELGKVVSDQLANHFPTIMDVGFTAGMEQNLDDIARGEKEWVPVLRDFYNPFQEALTSAAEEMPRVRVAEPSDETCDLCGKPMVIKTSRFGRFLACTGFPECKGKKPIAALTSAAEEMPRVRVAEPSDETCDLCGQAMVIKTGRFGRFLACTGFPECKGKKPIRVGVKCSNCDTGELVERKGKGRTFYGCSNYPECTFTVSQRPLPESCPECRGILVASGRNRARCSSCSYRGPVPERELVEAGV